MSPNLPRLSRPASSSRGAAGATASGFLPALLVGLFGGWAGTWVGGAGWAGSAAGDAALLGVGLGCGGLVAGLKRGDPLRLGRAGRILPAALLIAVLASLLASPVPRAGWVGVLLLPLYLLLPGIVAACWRSGAAAAAGVRAVSAVTAGVASWALGAFLLGATPRASEPLGHHNLLAAWLVILLPIAVLPARERGSWRLLGWAAGLLGVAALLASRSLAGAAALALQVLLLLAVGLRRSSRARKEDGGRAPVVLWARGLRWGLPVLLLIALGTQAERIGGVLAGGDSSARARMVYLEAGWDGFRARPALGWGPGSTPWTAAAFLRPVPGVNPPSELVGELHSLPVQLAYELGAPGLLLAVGLGVLFARRRLAELGAAPAVAQGAGGGAEPAGELAGHAGRHRLELEVRPLASPDRALAVAGLLGLLGAAVVALASAALAVTALPVAVAVAAGAALAGSRADAGAAAVVRSRPGRWFLPSYLMLLAAFLLPIRLASRHAERAIGADPARARQELARAVRLDPAFPLYRARLAWIQEATPDGRAVAAALARRAAGDSGAVIPLWLAAGRLGARAGEPWAAAALERACGLDPLGGFAPFELARLEPGDPLAQVRAGRAFVAEPRLTAAVAWERIPEVRREGLRSAVEWPGIPPAWGAALAEAAAAPLEPGGPTVPLFLHFDRDARSSFSLYLFRRRVSPTRWPVPLRATLVERFDLVPAALLPDSRRDAFEGPRCSRP